MSESRKFNVGTIVILALAGLFIIGALGYAVYSMVGSHARIEKSQYRYLVARERLENAREIAKQQARAEVAKHGKKATAERLHQAAVIKARRRPKVHPLDRLLGPPRDRATAVKGKPTEFPEGRFTAAEQEILDVADVAVDEHDLETAQDVAAEALKSSDARVRLRAVEMLTEFGEAGLPELADFLKDRHGEVANLAADRFELGVQEIEDDGERVAVAKLGVLTVDDPDKLASMMGTLTMATDQLQIISALADIIRDGSPAQIKAAKEAYESETGEEWTGIEAADQWLQENYEPPEPEEPEADELDEGSDEENDEDNGENT